MNALDRLRVELARCPFHETLRVEAISADDGTGEVAVRLPFRPELSALYGGGMFHGGVIASLIDLTGHATVALQATKVVPTIDLRIDYLKPAVGAYLVATGRPLRVGRAIGRADITVTDPTGTIVAVGRGTFSTL